MIKIGVSNLNGGRTGQSRCVGIVDHHRHLVPGPLDIELNAPDPGLNRRFKSCHRILMNCRTRIVTAAVRDHSTCVPLNTGDRGSRHVPVGGICRLFRHRSDSFPQFTHARGPNRYRTQSDVIFNNTAHRVGYGVHLRLGDDELPRRTQGHLPCGNARMPEFCRS